MNEYQTRWGAEGTPKIILQLLLAIGGISLAAALTAPILTEIFHIPPLDYWLGLSLRGIRSFFLWQFATFLFVEPGSGGGATLTFLLTLFFDLYVLWFAGGDLLSLVGNRPFLTFFFTCGLVSGAAAFAFAYALNHGGLICGPTPAILALFVVWAMRYSDREVLLFLLFPLKAKWIAGGLLAAIFLIQLSFMNLVGIVFYLTGPVVGYLYAVTAWGIRSPFGWMESIDEGLLALAQRMQKREQTNKIFDFKTGDPLLEDDKFMDAMLEKIARNGPSSLTHREKKRMEEISEQKRSRKIR